MHSSSTENANLVRLFTDPLETLGLSYMVTGSVAATIYGEPRLTHDVDVVLALAAKADAQRLCAAFPDEQFYCAPIEVVQVEARRSQRGHFNIIHHETGFKADIYLVGADPLHRWAMQRRREVTLEGGHLWVAPAEYVILRKLQFYAEGGSHKHLDDIRAMLMVSYDQIDRDELEDKIKHAKLETQWAQVLAAEVT